MNKEALIARLRKAIRHQLPIRFQEELTDITIDRMAIELGFLVSEKGMDVLTEQGIRFVYQKD
jgi:hypothetical protein